MGLQDVKKAIEKSNIICEKYVPKTLSALNTVSLTTDILNNVRERREQFIRALSRIDTENDYYKIKVLQADNSNNWLRLHGYPMKRRKH